MRFIEKDNGVEKVKNGFLIAIMVGFQSTIYSLIPCCFKIKIRFFAPKFRHAKTPFFCFYGLFKRNKYFR
jgi:hypothetical protein